MDENEEEEQIVDKDNNFYLQKGRMDFHNILEFDKSNRKNIGGGGNFTSYQHSIERHLKNPTHIIQEKE